MRNASKLEKFFDRQLNSDLKDVIITRDKTGVYDLYGKYMIEQDAFGFFAVRSTATSLRSSFSSLKTAMCWCVLHNEGMHNQASRIKELDSKIVSIQFDLAVHKKLFKNARPDNKLIFQIKIQEDTYKRKQALKELDSYINSSKSIQTRKFGNKQNFSYS